jgi:arylsulfatase A-like enzyme
MGRNYRSKSIISNVDFAATVLDYAGVDIPSKMDGKSLRNVIDDPSTKVHDSVLLVQNWGWIGSDHCKGLAVATEDHKYINWCYADENVPPSEELFDLESDPYELNDLSNDPGKQSVMAKMRSFYDEHHEHWSEYCVETEDYTRYRTIFDRNIPWQDKNYRGFKPGNSNSDKIQQIYEDLTGSPPPG